MTERTIRVRMNLPLIITSKGGGHYERQKYVEVPIPPSKGMVLYGHFVRWVEISEEQEIVAILEDVIFTSRDQFVEYVDGLARDGWVKK